jgi:hypothetical protein
MDGRLRVGTTTETFGMTEAPHRNGQSVNEVVAGRLPVPAERMPVKRTSGNKRLPIN